MTPSTVARTMATACGVVFDKDGTLIDLDARWKPWFTDLVDRLAARCGDASLVAALSATLGIDDTGLVADGPAAVDTTEQIIARIVDELVARRHELREAQELVRAVVVEAGGRSVGSSRSETSSRRSRHCARQAFGSAWRRPTTGPTRSTN